MAKKQTKHLDTSWDAEPTPGPEPAVELFDPTTEQPIAVDVLEPVVTYMPAPGDPLLPVRLELPQSVLFALIDAEHPDADLIGAAYYGLVALDGLTPLGEKALAGIDQTALRHKLNAARRIERNKRIEG